MIQQAFAVVLAPIAAFIVHHAPTSQNAVWVLMLLGALVMSLGYPGSKNVSARKIIEWGFVQPMVAAGSIVMYFVMFEGYPISLDLVLLGVALFLLFVMSTQVVFIAHAVPELLTDKRFQGTLKRMRRFRPIDLMCFCCAVSLRQGHRHRMEFVDGGWHWGFHGTVRGC